MNSQFSILNSQNSKLLSTLAIDAVLVGLAILVPALSHLTALPLYRLNPMLLVLLAGMVMVDDRRNSLLLAISLPLVSYWLVGMPTLPKALCMAAEFATLVSVFPFVRGKRATAFATCCGMMAAMLCAKGVYYLLKWVLMDGILIETPLSLQLFTWVGYSLIFALAIVAVNHLRDKRCGRGRC